MNIFVVLGREKPKMCGCGTSQLQVTSYFQENKDVWGPALIYVLCTIVTEARTGHLGSSCVDVILYWKYTVNKHENTKTRVFLK